MKRCPVNLQACWRFGWADAEAMYRTGSFLLAVCFLLLALVTPDVSHAGVFSVNPTRLELSRDVPSAVMQVVNAGAEDTTIQLHILQWTQIDGEDQFKASRHLISTPQIFNLRAGGTQIIRIGLPGKPDSSTESAYRLILEEIPSPPAPGFTGLQVALKVSIPVFVTNEVIAKSRQDLAIQLDGQGTESPEKIRVNMHNKGLKHIQLRGMQIFSNDEKQEMLANYDKNTYLLAGQKRLLTISLKEKLVSEGVLIKANTRDGIVEFHAKPGLP